VIVTEAEILAAYSTPGLRRRELSRAAKKEHLATLKVVGEKAEEILTRLYPADAAAEAKEGQ
jgi:hypothetical protein